MKKVCKKFVGLVLIVSLFCLPGLALGADSTTSPTNLNNQTQVEAAILAEFNAGEYDVENPLVKLDPYGWSPLTALVLFDTAKAATVEVTVKGKDEQTTIRHDFETLSIHHEIPVYGLYPGQNNDVTLKVNYEKGQTIVKHLQIQTAPLPENDFITADVVTCDPGQVEDGLTFMVPAVPNENRTCAIDQNGDVRWYLDNKIAGGTNEIKRLANGHLQLVSGKLDTSAGGIYYKSSFYEMDLLGKIYTEFLRNGLHHDIQELPNGDFIAVTNKYGRNTTEDYMVILDRTTGMVKDSLDLKQIFPVWQQTPDDPDKITPDACWGNSKDWFHQNTVWYNQGDNSILISGRQQDAVVKIDLATKEVVWILSDPNDYWPDNLKDKLLTPVAGDTDFQYQYGQHAVMQLPNGDIFLFDNGNYRSKDPATALPAAEDYSRAVIYRVNEQDKTVEQIWEYGKERGSELYCPYICDVDYFEDGHYLIDFGGIGGFGTVVTGTGVSCSHIIEIKNDKVIGETVITKVDESGTNVNANMYRVERMEAYTDQDKEYELGKHEGQTLGKLFEQGDVEE
jgi:Arylsulfotransferase (ASST).